MPIRPFVDVIAICIANDPRATTGSPVFSLLHWNPVHLLRKHQQQYTAMQCPDSSFLLQQRSVSPILDEAMVDRPVAMARARLSGAGGCEMRWDFNDMQEHLAAMAARASADRSQPDLAADCQCIFDMINAMTPDERSSPDLLLDRPRRERIARDAGVPLADVDELVAQRQGMATIFAQMRQRE